MTRLFDRPKYKVLFVFLQWLSLIVWHVKAAWDKQTRDIDRRAIGISSICDAAFLYLPFFPTVLRGICYIPIFPSCRKCSWTAGENGIKMSKVQDRMLSSQKIKHVPFPIAMPRGVQVSIEVSRVYFFYVDLFIYLFIYLFIHFFASLSEQGAPDTQKFSVH